jgi:hypothetical protein
MHEWRSVRAIGRSHDRHATEVDPFVVYQLVLILYAWLEAFLHLSPRNWPLLSQIIRIIIFLICEFG